jgi:pimeloyl-ACP methyl ester carboxylesterase
MLILLASLGGLGLIGYGGQRLAESRDRKRFAAPGRLVTVDGLVLHAVVEGSGPVVLIDSGLGGGCLEWEAVAAGLRDHATVVRYDRPGFGWSPAADCDRSPVAAAERLRGLLSALSLEGPVVAVGHSLGGLHVRVLAQLHPELVSGLVLVDPSHEDMLDATPTPRAAKVDATVIRGIAAVAPLGMARVGGRLYSGTVVAQLRKAPDEATRSSLRRTTLLTSCSVSGLRAATAELTGLEAALRQVQEVTASRPVPPVPLVVISAAAPGRSEAEAKGRLVMDDLHVKQAAVSPLGRRVLAEHSGHLVPLDEPEVVVAAVLETLKAVQ